MLSNFIRYMLSSISTKPMAKLMYNNNHKFYSCQITPLRKDAKVFCAMIFLVTRKCH